MKKLKVVTILGTRPEIIRLSRLIPKLDEHTDHTLVHTGQNYDRELNEVFFEDLELRQRDYYLDVDTSSLGAVMGDTLRKAEEVFIREKPDAVMILGDTNSAIAAVVAERMHIPVYHMEAGNRSFDANVPEELNRRMVDHVSSFNLPYNDYSMRNLLDEGINPRFIHKTGSTMLEIVRYYEKFISSSKILEQLNLVPGGYFLASIHRQENVDNPLRLTRVLEVLEGVQNERQKPVIVSTHPRTQRRLDDLQLVVPDGITFAPPFGYFDYNRLQVGAFCVISDSGTVSEESSILNFPAVTLRESMERPEALAAGTVLMTGLDVSSALSTIRFAVNSSRARSTPEGYEVQDFSDRVII